MNVPKRNRSVVAFTDALCRLVSDASVQKITVTGICAEAGYTSMAFYSNFENKSDFLYSIIDYEAQIFANCVYQQLEETQQLPHPPIIQMDFHRRYMTDFFEHVLENRTLYQCILNNQFVADGIGLLSKRIAHHMRPYLMLKADDYPDMPNFTAFVLEITEAQMLMVVRYWLSKMPSVEPSAIAELYCSQFLFRSFVPIERDPQSGIFRAGL